MKFWKALMQKKWWAQYVLAGGLMSLGAIGFFMTEGIQVFSLLSFFYLAMAWVFVAVLSLLFGFLAS